MPCVRPPLKGLAKLRREKSDNLQAPSTVLHATARGEELNAQRPSGVATPVATRFPQGRLNGTSSDRFTTVHVHSTTVISETSWRPSG